MDSYVYVRICIVRYEHISTYAADVQYLVRSDKSGVLYLPSFGDNSLRYDRVLMSSVINFTYLLHLVIVLNALYSLIFY